jgi:Na+/H+ antiporter NhaD/arsenite permease-like protein
MRHSIFFLAILLSIGSFCAVKAFPLNGLRSTCLLISNSSIGANDVSAVFHRVALDKHSEHARVETPSLPPNWLIVPFLLFLGMIATGPLLYAHFWHRYYPTLSILLASFVVLYYVLILHDSVSPLSTIIEYVQFIALIGALYMAAGGILIKIDRIASPTLNLGILFSGAILSNLIGTTGASMLLIRPYIRLNQPHAQIYHIIFFIFMVSNVGGALTPMGDPPLFLGFLKGVPFSWTLQYNFLPWLLVLAWLGLVFFFFEWKYGTKKLSTAPPQQRTGTAAIAVIGKRNFVWLLLIIGAVFLDPSLFEWLPTIDLHGHPVSFIRELLLFAIAGLSYRYADPVALQENAFSLAPIKEVVLLFVGIFCTMMPALSLISKFAQSEAGLRLISHNTLYWFTGSLSSMLDNAPTYLNFLAASMAAQGADISQPIQVAAYATGKGFYDSILQLKAISLGAVFFGAMTYIGNGPNFMVKTIAEELGMSMPSFLSYILRFAIPFLLPALWLVWLLFFHWQWL